ncbi:MAG: helix-turn-helix transcriptional regulator [Planctomycetes bacterium]|nr:helix-turn-helix transcriptional regulator [Planctomycetota bacterium]
MRTLRRRFGYENQQALATAVGVSKSTVSRWEQGTHFPDAMELARLCDLFKVAMPFLVGTCSSESGLEPGTSIVHEENEARAAAGEVLAEGAWVVIRVPAKHRLEFGDGVNRAVKDGVEKRAAERNRRPGRM